MSNGVILKSGFSKIIETVRAQAGAITAGAVERALNTERLPTIVIVGQSGVGKSSTINAMFGAGQKVDAVRPGTTGAVGMTVRFEDGGAAGVPGTQVMSGSQGLLRVFDMPGLDDDVSNFAHYMEVYRKVLAEADVVLWIHEAKDRRLGPVQEHVKRLFGESGLPHLAERLVFGLNMADLIEPANWDLLTQCPSSGQQAHLDVRREEVIKSIQRALPSWRPRVVYYSAKYAFQLAVLFQEMLDAVPPERRWILQQRMDLLSIRQVIDERLLRAVLSEQFEQEEEE